jgi:hypothetical protein
MDLGMSPGNIGEPASVRIHASGLGVLNEILESSFCAQLCTYAADLTSTQTPPGVVRSQAAQPSPRTPSTGLSSCAYGGSW